MLKQQQEAELAEVHPWEEWVLAASTGAAPAVSESEYEDDLFAGLRATDSDRVSGAVS